MHREFTDQEIVRQKKLKSLVENGKNPFELDHFKRTHSTRDILSVYGSQSREDLNTNKTATIIKIAGRVRNKRIIGSACFINLQDRYGFIQIFIKKSNVSQEAFASLKEMDLGDIIGVTGWPMRTRTNELSIEVTDFVLLVKSLRVLPDKHSGFKNVEDRFRHRYVDLIVNPEVQEIFVKRFKIIRSIQNFLDSKDYVEVETPILQNLHGGAAAQPFSTHHNALHKNLFLRVATELHLKRLIVGGMEKVYEIGRLFRNEGIDTTHNPEFTSIEVYTAYDNMLDTMQLCEDIFRNAAQQVLGTTIFTTSDVEINFQRPFKRIHMVEAIKQATGIDFWKITDIKVALALAEKHNLEVSKHFSKVGHIINLFFEEYVEKTLVQPTFVYGHPVAISPLAKANKDNNLFTDRFELFILGREYANAFSELNDPHEQYARFVEQVKEKDQGNSEAQDIDLDFIEALEYGLPPTGGLGIGIDRLVMLLTNQSSIREVLLFPTLKDK